MIARDSIMNLANTGKTQARLRERFCACDFLVIINIVDSENGLFYGGRQRERTQVVRISDAGWWWLVFAANASRRLIETCNFVVIHTDFGAVRSKRHSKHILLMALSHWLATARTISDG